MDRPSPAVQDYLKAIYRLDESAETTGPVTTTQVAEALAVTTASASNMLKKLDTLGYVVHVKRQGVELTDAGRQAALEVIRHHRLLETFLATRLGMPWDEVHREAEVLEHHVSGALADRIAEALGHPERDPHGHPIPTSAGHVAPTSARRLTELADGVVRGRGARRRPRRRAAALPGRARPGARRPRRGHRARALRRADRAARGRRTGWSMCRPPPPRPSTWSDPLGAGSLAVRHSAQERMADPLSGRSPVKRLPLLAVIAAGLAALSLGLSACGDDDSSSADDDDDARPRPATTAPTTTAPATTAPARPRRRGAVPIALEADPSGALKYVQTTLTATAGAVDITFTNDSAGAPRRDHRGQGRPATIISGGKTSDLKIADLPAGTYTYYCSVPGHEQAGMKGTLTVE